VTDRELLGYARLHCRTDRALFNDDQINRILKLAGRVERVSSGWYAWHEEDAIETIEAAERNLLKEEQP
jgi:hypothetical protein